MIKNTKYIQTGYIFILLLGLLTIQSCKKTVYEQLKRPYSDIQQFAIAGYGDLDSIQAVINGDNILLYWNADVATPEKIKPTIKISNGATISPASGEEVTFSESTVYTVIAEDGSKHQYKLKPVFNVTVPVLFKVPVKHIWASPTSLEILGEYFFAGGDASAIKVYAQRLRDGFEFDIPVDIAKTTKTKIVVNLPILTSELDTGAHRIYVKVGDFASNSENISLDLPTLSNIVTGIRMDKTGDVKLGEEITFEFTVKQGWENALTRYYSKKNIQSFQLGLAPLAGGNGRSVSNALDLISTSEAGNITVKLNPDFYKDYTDHRVFGAVVRYNAGGQFQFDFSAASTPYPIPVLLWPVIRNLNYQEQVTLKLAQEGQLLRPGQELAINCTFRDEQDRNKYQDKIRNVQLIFINMSNGQSNTIAISQGLTTNGGQIKFTLPESASSIKRYNLRAMSANFYISRTENITPTGVIKDLNTKISDN